MINKDSYSEFPFTAANFQPGSLMGGLIMENKNLLAASRKGFSFQLTASYPAEYKKTGTHLWDIVAITQYFPHTLTDAKFLFKGVTEIQRDTILDEFKSENAKTLLYHKPKKLNSIIDTLDLIAPSTSSSHWPLPKLLTTKQIFFPPHAAQYSDYDACEGAIFDKVRKRMGYGVYQSKYLSEENIELLDCLASQRQDPFLFPTQFYAVHKSASLDYESGMIFDSESTVENNQDKPELVTTQNAPTTEMPKDYWFMYCVEPTGSQLVYATDKLAQIKADLEQFEKEFILPYYNESRRLSWSEEQLSKISGYDPTHHSALSIKKAQWFDNWNVSQENESYEILRDPTKSEVFPFKMKNSLRPLGHN